MSHRRTIKAGKEWGKTLIIIRFIRYFFSYYYYYSCLSPLTHDPPDKEKECEWWVVSGERKLRNYIIAPQARSRNGEERAVTTSERELDALHRLNFWLSESQEGNFNLILFPLVSLILRSLRLLRFDRHEWSMSEWAEREWATEDVTGLMLRPFPSHTKSRRRVGVTREGERNERLTHPPNDHPHRCFLVPALPHLITVTRSGT